MKKPIIVSTEDLRDAAILARRAKLRFPTITRRLAQIGALSIVERTTLADGETSIAIRYRLRDIVSFRIGSINSIEEE